MKLSADKVEMAIISRVGDRTQMKQLGQPEIAALVAEHEAAEELAAEQQQQK